MSDRLDQLFETYEPGGFDSEFSDRVMDRLATRREHEAVIVPMFVRTGLAAALLMLSLMSYNLAASEEGDVFERLFGVPPATTIMEAYSHDIEPNL